MRAEEIMTADVKTVDEGVTIGQAYELMEAAGVRHLPVLRGSELVGILSDRDMRCFGLSMISDFEDVETAQARLNATVASVMSSDLVTVGRDTSVADIVDVMLEEGIHAVPVVDDETNHLVGIVTTVDMLGAVRDCLAD